MRFDELTRAIYSTDASHYEIEPLGVVFPRSTADVEAVMRVAREEGVPILPRGGGTSQCGQTVGRAVVVDTSRWLTRIGDVRGGSAGHGSHGTDAGVVVDVEPGVVLDRLNRSLRRHGLWFPVDPSTGSRATLGGMVGNNSAGSRSLRYGMTIDNVEGVEGVLPGGAKLWFGEGVLRASGVDGSAPVKVETSGRVDGSAPAPAEEIRARLRRLYARAADDIADTAVQTMRNVAGYRVESLAPPREHFGHLLVGSEGTLAFFTRLRLRLAPLPRRRVLGVCHFPGLYAALSCVEPIVGLGPSAVELVDDKVLGLAASRPEMEAVLRTFVRGRPSSLLLVEFEEGEPTVDLIRSLDALDEVLSDHGHPGSLVRIESDRAQAKVWAVRRAGLGIVMSMAGPRKPVSFIEDCAVPLEHLEDYARRIDSVFARNGLEGTWYAHASVGCLHVRPALNLADPDDVKRMRVVAEETHEIIRELGGTHSGEHGDGIVRSEFLAPMLGNRMTALYAEVKGVFDPGDTMNPGKIVRPMRMDDTSLFRRPLGRVKTLPAVLNWQSQGGLAAAVARCDNNGACRKLDAGVMCPSYRVTLDERHSTRGRANALRHVLASGEAEARKALGSPELAEAMSLCISCKGCQRECPQGVDMATLKLEWLHHRNTGVGIPRRERILASLPRRAPRLSRFGQLLNMAGESRPIRAALSAWAGIAPARTLPRWSTLPWDEGELGQSQGTATNGTVALFVDTFTRWFEPEVARAAHRVLSRLGVRVVPLGPRLGRPLCCGRTYLSAGMLDEAREEAGRLVAAALPVVRDGLPIVGLEPSCLCTLVDEVPRLLGTDEASSVGRAARLFEEVVDELPGGENEVEREPHPVQQRVLIYPHCHQRAAGRVAATARALSKHLTQTTVSTIEAGCCGMAGSFGYHSEHRDISLDMAELGILPAVRAEPEALVVAPGTSCRAQIADGTGRTALHPAVVLERGSG